MAALLATPIFGLAIGVATTAAYTAAARHSGDARGTGFGLLTTASLTGLALSPVVSGLLGATSIRAVFLLDVVALDRAGGIVSRLMIAAPPPETTAPATEEILKEAGGRRKEAGGRRQDRRQKRLRPARG